MTEEMLRLMAAQRREKQDLLLRIDRAWGSCARQARQARRALHRLEGVLALTTEEFRLRPEAVQSEPSGQGETQLEALTRQLAAARQEIRQYETRLFACERTILALKKENAGLESLCAKARSLGFLPEQEEIHGPFWPDGGPQPAEGNAAAQSPAAAEEDAPSWLDAPLELLDPPEPPLPPAPEPGPLDKMTSEVLGQLDHLMARENIPLKQSAYLRGKMG